MQSKRGRILLEQQFNYFIKVGQVERNPLKQEELEFKVIIISNLGTARIVEN